MSESTITLPKSLQKNLAERARKAGLSVDDYIRTVLEQRIRAEKVLDRVKPHRLKGGVPQTLAMLKKARRAGRE